MTEPHSEPCPISVVRTGPLSPVHAERLGELWRRIDTAEKELLSANPEQLLRTLLAATCVLQEIVATLPADIPWGRQRGRFDRRNAELRCLLASSGALLTEGDRRSALGELPLLESALIRLRYLAAILAQLIDRRRIRPIHLLCAAFALYALMNAAVQWHLRGHGLTAEYFQGTELAGPSVLQRVEPQISFSGWGELQLPGQLGTHLSGRWTGSLNAPEQGEYRFIVRNDDGARLWIDGMPLIDDWHNHPPTFNRATVQLGAGWHDLRLEYFQNEGDLTLKLFWARPGRRVEPLSSWYLWPTARPNIEVR